MQRPMILTILILAIAVLSFAALAYENVPVSTTSTLTQTILQQNVEKVDSYLTYVTSSTENQTFPFVLLSETIGIARSMTFFQQTATILYSQTLTSSITKTSTSSATSLVPESEALGLTDWSFSVLAIVVIGILILVTIWTALRRTLHHKPKQPVPTQFVKPSSTTFCINCGSQLLPESKFCNNCGAKQP